MMNAARNYWSSKESWFVNLCRCVENWYAGWVRCFKLFLGHCVYMIPLMEIINYNPRFTSGFFNHRCCEGRLVVFDIL